MTQSNTSRQGTSRRVTVVRSSFIASGRGGGQGGASRFFGGPKSRTLGLAGLAAERERAKARLKEIEDCACTSLTILLLSLTTTTALGVESRKDLADLRREDHPDTDDPLLDAFTMQNDDGDGNWEDEPEAGEEAAVLAIRDLLGVR